MLPRALVNSPREQCPGAEQACWSWRWGCCQGWQAQRHVSLQEEKVYVQHRIQENRRLVWELLSGGSAHVYLAG